MNIEVRLLDGTWKPFRCVGNQLTPVHGMNIPMTGGSGDRTDHMPRFFVPWQFFIRLLIGTSILGYFYINLKVPVSLFSHQYREQPALYGREGKQLTVSDDESPLTNSRDHELSDR